MYQSIPISLISICIISLGLAFYLNKPGLSPYMSAISFTFYVLLIIPACWSLCMIADGSYSVEGCGKFWFEVFRDSFKDVFNNIKWREEK